MRMFHWWIAISSIAPIGLLMSGYGSNNKITKIHIMKTFLFHKITRIPILFYIYDNTCAPPINLVDIDRNNLNSIPQYSLFYRMAHS